MYAKYRQMRRQQGPVDYVLPFLIIVCVGIILILVWNLWKALFGEDTTRAAYLHVIDGSAQMKTWNTDDYFSLSTDVVVRQGDEISVSNGSKVIVEFFDGTIMRMGGGSTVRFDLLDDKNDNPQLEISLLDGMIWINKIYKGTAETGLSIDLADIIVDSRAAGIFEVESGEDMAVRIFDVFNEDGVLVEILEKGGDKVVEEENVGVGQEVVLNDKILERYWQHQSPSVLAAVSDEFKQGDWYKWNVAEDTKPTVFEKFAGVDGAGLVKVEPEEVVGNGEIVEPENTDAEDKPSVVPESSALPAPAAAVNTSGLQKPTITSVAGGAQLDANGFYRVTSRVATLTGGISGAAKVIVNDYTLQKFKAGDVSWSYFANADFGLMKVGENIYQVYAVDAAGNKSEPLTVKVFYTPPASEPEENKPESVTDPGAVNLDIPGDAPID